MWTSEAVSNVSILHYNPAYVIETSALVGTVVKLPVGTFKIIESPVAVSVKVVTSGVIFAFTV